MEETAFEPEVSEEGERKVTTVFRPTSGSSVYRQTVEIRRPQASGQAWCRPGGAGPGPMYQVISPNRRFAMSAATGRPMAVTPVQIRTTLGGGPGAMTANRSAPGNLGIKRPLDFDFSMNVKRFGRTNDKSKGLRHFSTKVCEKVKQKGRTNYNEVADELVQEYFESLNTGGDLPKFQMQDKQTYDMKNIRRRVYDALNVLMAMNIIEKEKKEIRWVGLPTSSLQECRRLQEEKLKRVHRIREKAEQLQELVIQLVTYKSLVERNREDERAEGRPLQNTLLYLPYIVINTDKKTMIDCSISHDKTEYLFNFDQPFEIHDDIEVLKRLGLAHGLEKGQVKTEEDRNKIKSYLPETMRIYVDKILDKTLGGAAALPPTLEVEPPRKGARLVRRQPDGSLETRIPLVTTRLVKPPNQYITNTVQQSGNYVQHPTTTATMSHAPDYGSGAFHSRFARRPAPIAQSTQSAGGVRYHVMSRQNPDSSDQKHQQQQPDHHSYSNPVEEGDQSGSTGVPKGISIRRPPGTYVLAPEQRKGPPIGIRGSPVVHQFTARSHGVQRGYAEGVMGDNFGVGESDEYSDMDRMGSNSNDGY